MTSTGAVDQEVCGGTMKATVVENGAFVYTDIPLPEPIDRKVLIQVKAIGVNRIDLYMAQGKMGPIDVIGVEASGIVVQTAPDCETDVKIGDEVACLVKDGSYAAHVLADERLLLPRPVGGSLSFSTMASIPENWLTAYQLLHFEARVQPGETILLHAAASGVGTAVIQLAKSFGVDVIGTAGSPEKLESVLKHGAIGAVNYKTENFAEKVQSLTNNAGVDVVLDCVGESHAKKNLEVLKIDGRWILFGLLGGIHAPEAFLAAIMKKRLSIRGTTLRTRSIEYQAKLVDEFKRHAWDKMADQQFHVPISKTFPLSEVEEAHAFMKQNANIGKIVLLP